MQYIVLEDKQLIIFWSPKCGCSTLKTIIAKYFDIDNSTYRNIHVNKELQQKINVRKKKYKYLQKL